MSPSGPNILAMGLKLGCWWALVPGLRDWLVDGGKACSAAKVERRLVLSCRTLSSITRNLSKILRLHNYQATEDMTAAEIAR